MEQCAKFWSLFVLKKSIFANRWQKEKLKEKQPAKFTKIAKDIFFCVAKSYFCFWR